MELVIVILVHPEPNPELRSTIAFNALILVLHHFDQNSPQLHAVHQGQAANIIDGALKAVPFGQRETGSAFGLSQRQVFFDIHLPQMWRYALPGFSNLWLILIKATPLLFLLGIQDIIYYADLLGKMATRRYSTYPHGDWKLWYFIALGVFYLLLTMLSQLVFTRLERRFNKGMVINETTSGRV